MEQDNESFMKELPKVRPIPKLGPLPKMRKLSEMNLSRQSKGMILSGRAFAFMATDSDWAGGLLR